MSSVKWVKICTDMARNKKIKRIRKLPEGNNIVLIWVMLLLQAGESNKEGALFITNTMPFTLEDLAIEFDFPIDIMKIALITLEKYEMIEVFDDVIFIKNWKEYQNIEGMDKIREQTRKRVSEHRQRRKLLAENNIHTTVVSENDNCNGKCNVTVTQCNATEKEKEKELKTLCDESHVVNSLTNSEDSHETNECIDTQEISAKNEMENKNECINSDNKNSDIEQCFEALWDLYPSKKGKGKVSNTTKKKLYQLGFKTISTCIERYKDTKEDWKNWQNGSTFFTSGYIDYLDENYTEEKQEEYSIYHRS